MKEITLKNLQESILKIDNTKGAIDKYFQKLVEEVGELSRAMRKDIRLENSENIKGTIEEELYDILKTCIILT